MQVDRDRGHTRHGRVVGLPSSRGAGKRTADCAAMQSWCWSGDKEVVQGLDLKTAKVICRRDRVAYGLKCENDRLKHTPLQVQPKSLVLYTRTRASVLIVGEW